MARKVKNARDLIIKLNEKDHMVCSKCNTPKELNEENFYRKNKGTDWITICKDCKKQYYNDNKEKKQEYQLEYSNKNREYYREYMKHYDKSKGGAVDFSMEEFKSRPTNTYEEKLISVDGVVTTKDNRQFTRLVGGFGDNKPMFTVWQVAELFNVNTKSVIENFNYNKDRFDVNIDYVNLKVGVGNFDSEKIKNDLKHIYHVNKLNATKDWIIFSQSGLLKILKTLTTKEAWSFYESFIEDYFKTKVELVVAEKTIQENSDVLIDTKKMLLGSIFLEQDDTKRMDLMCQVEKINNQLIDNAKTLGKEETLEQMKDIIAIADKFTNSNGCYDIANFCNLLDIKGLGRNKMFAYMRKNKILKDDNTPYQNMSKYFKVVKVDKNNRQYIKTLLKGKGIQYIVKKLINDGYLEYTYEDVMDRIKDLEIAS